MGCVPSTEAACYICPLRYKIFAAYLPQVCLRLLSSGSKWLRFTCREKATRRDAQSLLVFTLRRLLLLCSRLLLALWLRCSDAPRAAGVQSRAAIARSAFSEALGGAGT